jgi:hypothetical protein
MPALQSGDLSVSAQHSAASHQLKTSSYALFETVATVQEIGRTSWRVISIQWSVFGKND